MKIHPFPALMSPRSKQTLSHRHPPPPRLIPIPLQENPTPTVNGSFLFGGFEDAHSAWKTLSSQRRTASSSTDSRPPNASLSSVIATPAVRSDRRGTIRGEIDLRLPELGVFLVWAQALSDSSFVFMMLVNRSADRTVPPVLVSSPSSNQGFRTALVFSSDHPSAPWAVRLIPEEAQLAYTHEVIPI